MEEPKKNKAVRPDESKAPEEPMMVRIRFRPQRSAEGVKMDENNEALVSRELANYLLSIGYADEI